MRIAIDGPSGAGKSTVSKMLAKKLDLIYIDTGAMYRAVALYALDNGAKFVEEEIQPILKDIKIDIRYGRGRQKIILNGRDVSALIRKHIISKLASEVSKIPAVRLYLVELQRGLAGKHDAVLDGRDIGTYVLPDADFKFFVTASLQERAKRRYLELNKKNEHYELEQITKDIQQRDYSDINREFAPLKKADDAIEIDTTNLTLKQVVAHMIKIIDGGRH